MRPRSTFASWRTGFPLVPAPPWRPPTSTAPRRRGFGCLVAPVRRGSGPWRGPPRTWQVGSCRVAVSCLLVKAWYDYHTKLGAFGKFVVYVVLCVIAVGTFWLWATIFGPINLAIKSSFWGWIVLIFSFGVLIGMELVVFGGLLWLANKFSDDSN
jgi:hypothetical protein